MLPMYVLAEIQAFCFGGFRSIFFLMGQSNILSTSIFPYIDLKNLYYIGVLNFIR